MKPNQRTFFFVFIFACILALGCNISSKAGPANTPTAIPPTPIPGWDKFEGGGIELWMPNSFEGGDLTNDLDVILERMRSMDSQFQQMADMIEKNSSAFMLLVYDTNVGSSGFLTNVNVVKEKVLSGMTLDTYLDSSVKQLTPLGFNIIERKTVQLYSHEAGRLVIEVSALKAKELMYIIKAKNAMWVITYSTGISEFSSRWTTFEKSANTIRILP
jgi:hypothetical protein